MSERWIAVTAGLGTQNFRDAARRVQISVAKSKRIARCVAIFEEDLPFACPDTFAKYSEYLQASHHGFGYFSWKAEIVNSAFTGKWGDFDGVIWIDAGCEFNVSPLADINLSRWLKRAVRLGATAFTLETPEYSYTKKLILDREEFVNVSSEESQFQATWVILHGQEGKSIARNWHEICNEKIENVDYSNLGSGENPRFIEHRFDQSILSMVLKSRNIEPLPRHRPVAGVSFKSKLRGLFYPIWTSRNRYGKSMQLSWFHR